MPPSLDTNLDGVLFTYATKMITVASDETLQNETICSTSLGKRGDMVVYALVAQPGGSPDTGDKRQESPEEPFPGFESEIEQQLVKADALTTEHQRNELRKLFHEFQPIFSKDSQDCGVTDIHTVRIPTDPGAAPTFVRQYKIPLAAYESIQEILDKLLEKRIVRECNST